MLVLSRNVSESIRIGDDIVINILRSDGQVRIGIDAPKDVPVHRPEVYDRILADKGPQLMTRLKVQAA